MDTKLKNRHKLAIIIMILTVMIPALVIAGNYGSAYLQMKEFVKEDKNNLQMSEEFIEKFIEATYVFYNTEQTDKKTAEHAKQVESFLNGDYYGEYMEYGGLDLNDFLSKLDYSVVDENDQVVTKMMTNSFYGDLNENSMSSYRLGITITYDENGIASGTINKSIYKQEQNIVLKKCLSDGISTTPLGDMIRDQENYDGEQVVEFEVPKNRTYYFGMQEDELNDYLEEYLEVIAGHTMNYAPDWMMNVLLFCMLFVALIAIFIPCFKTLRTGDEKIFFAPFEIPLIVLPFVVAASVDVIGVRISQSCGDAFPLDLLLWIAVFCAIYWSVTCLRHLFTMGPRQYLEKSSIIIPLFRVLKRGTKKAVKMGAGGIDKLYHSFDDLDFSEKNNKAILKIVLINFAILFVVTCMWFVGIFALIIYSILLFFILRKYFNDLKSKYECILNVTNQMAEGKLDVELDEDLGIFNSFKNELVKIQDGYQKAVEKEVKSQRTKTELITNVSHDLKTPLTAIITYVNLLKEEKDAEKQKEYIDVLERKSMRLKALIEDLFEVSKASSKDVTLHLSDVDVVSLFKQVHLELKEKCEESKLDFRCIYPEERLVSELDSQKTYRIFENLLVNVSKYAMPNTRVYVTIEKEDEMVSVQIMNISANELTISAEELTERFVRGDLSRNTEGSGLGLAIAKSFTELQKGSFHIEIEGDLFKAKVSFPLKNK
ncbi:MAG: sensor histidine kinase [Lachnospiraceae bacterium]